MAFWILLLSAPSVGSFLGVLVTRLPSGRGIVVERSRCDACGLPLRFWQMVPVLSWVLLRGRCAQCGAAVSAFYPLVEISSVLVVLAVSFAFKGFPLAFACMIGWILIVMSFIAFRAKPALSGYHAPLAIIAGLGWILWLGALYENRP